MTSLANPATWIRPKRQYVYYLKEGSVDDKGLCLDHLAFTYSQATSLIKDFLLLLNRYLGNKGLQFV